MMFGRRPAAARFVCRSCTRQLEQRVRPQQQQQRLQLQLSRQGQQQQQFHHRASGWRPQHQCRPHPQKQQRFFANAAEALVPDMDDIYDVVCVGGGPAGLSLLTALRANPATANLRLALIEAQDLDKLRTWTPSPDQFANRCSSLTPASARFLNHVGAWPHLHRDRVQAYQAMQVWDGITGAQIAFDWPLGAPTNPETGSTIAYMVENVNLTSGLLSRLDELGGVTYFDNRRVSSIGFGSDGLASGGPDLSQWPAVQLDGGDGKKKTLLARLLVGADGANSPVRSFADITARGWDYNRHGVVATLKLEEGGGSISGDAFKTAYQRFLPTGPVALLPLPGRFATLVWSTTPERAQFLKSLGQEDFVAMVNAAFRLRPVDLTYLHSAPAEKIQSEVAWRLREDAEAANADGPEPIAGVQAGSVASFPLRLRHADDYIGERVALVGDAAHTVHPLAGQGLNQGQGDVESLSRTIAYAVEHGQDLGVRTSLEPYPAERYAANHVLMGVCDKLHKLYVVESGPLVPLRSLGLQAVNALRPVKDAIMRQAAGDNGMRL